MEHNEHLTAANSQLKHAFHPQAIPSGVIVSPDTANLKPADFGMTPETWLVSRVSILLAQSQPLAQLGVAPGIVKVDTNIVFATMLLPNHPPGRPEIQVAPIAALTIGELETTAAAVVNDVFGRVQAFLSGQTDVIDG